MKNVGIYSVQITILKLPKKSGMTQYFLIFGPSFFDGIPVPSPPPGVGISLFLVNCDALELLSKDSEYPVSPPFFTANLGPPGGGGPTMKTFSRLFLLVRTGTPWYLPDMEGGAVLTFDLLVPE